MLTLRKSMLLLVPFLGLACCLAACGNDSHASSNSTSGAGGSSGGALVAECKMLAKNFEDKCAGDAPRPCLWKAYGQLCETGNTQLLVDAMKCLDPTLCRILSDPNDGESCLVKLHQNDDSSAVKSYFQKTCASCQTSNCSDAEGISEVLPYLNDDDIAAVASCGAKKCNLDDLIVACKAVPGVAPFDACEP